MSHGTISATYLSREVCTSLQIKNIFASEALIHNLNVRGFTLQRNNTKKVPISDIFFLKLLE